MSLSHPTLLSFTIDSTKRNSEFIQIGKTCTLFVLAAIILVLHPIVSLGQKNYVSGRIVTVEGDTVDGLIDYRNWRKNPTTISFKEDTLSASRKLGPSQIRWFRAEGDRYRSAEVSIDRTPYDPDELVREPVIERDRVFLQLYLQGEASLYFYLERDRPHFFVQKGQGAIKEIVSRRLLGYRNNRKIILRQELYKTQLASHFRECPELTGNLEDLRFKEKEMVRIFEAYNRCRETSVTYIRNEEKTKLRLYLVGGLSIARPQIEIDRYSTSGEVIYASSFNPVVGISLDVVFPRNRRKWSLYNELVLTSHRSESVSGTSLVSGSYAKLTNMARLRLFAAPTRMFLNIGFSNAFALEVAGDTNTLEDRKYLNGFLAGLGVETPHFNGEIRFGWGSGLNRNRTYYYYLRKGSVVIAIPL